MNNTEVEIYQQQIGRVMRDVSVNADKTEMVFEDMDGNKMCFYHAQDCCETVSIEDIEGDLSDLVGSPIVVAECVTHNNENPPGVKVPEWQDSYTWTFYRFATAKGFVTVRWYGESNGYYSESVDVAFKFAGTHEWLRSDGKGGFYKSWSQPEAQ